MRVHLVIIVLLAACAAHEPASKQTPQRIVTLAPNVTEMVIALGAGDRIAGTDDFSADAMPTRKLPRVGGLQPNLEKIVAVRPDLVIANAAGLQPNLGRSLATVHIPLLVVTNERLSDIAKSMTSIAGALGIDGRPAVAALNASLSRQRRIRPNPPRVMLAVWTDPLYVAGRNTFADDLITLCGAKNAVEVNGWPQYSLESFVAHPPDLLLYPNHSVTPQAVRALLLRAGTKKIKAVSVDENLFTRPGPRVGEAGEMLNAILDRRRGANSRLTLAPPQTQAPANIVNTKSSEHYLNIGPILEEGGLVGIFLVLLGGIAVAGLLLKAAFDSITDDSAGILATITVLCGAFAVFKLPSSRPLLGFSFVVIAALAGLILVLKAIADNLNPLSAKILLLLFLLLGAAGWIILRSTT